MLGALLQWILSALAVWVVSLVIPGFTIDGALSTLIAAVLIGLVNGTIGFVLKILTFPLTLVTLGLFLLVVNALMIMLVAAILPGFDVTGFWAAFFGGIVLSLVNMALNAIVPKAS